jgi:rod shape-determining protein MreD
MRWIPFIVFLAIIVLIASSSLGDMIAVGEYNIQPSLLLIVMVFFAINCETSEAIACSFIIGLAADISSTSMAMGPYTVSFGIVGTAISFVQSALVMKRLIYQMICIFATGLLTGTMVEAMTFSKLSGQTANSLAVIAMVTLYSAIIGPFLWLVFSAIFGMLVVEIPRHARKIE